MEKLGCEELHSSVLLINAILGWILIEPLISEQPEPIGWEEGYKGIGTKTQR